jgi:hypothetical protein
MESKGDCDISVSSPLWPGTDSDGYDAYAAQIFLMPWSWEYASNFVMTIDANVNCGRLIALAYNVSYPATWGYPTLNVNGGTVTTPGLRNFDANDPYDPCKFDNPSDPWIEGEGLWVGGGGSGTGENYGFVNIRNDGKIVVPRIRIYNGTVNLYPDGLLYDTNSDPANFYISQAHAINKINILGGTLRLAGDRRDEIYASTRIIPYENRGYLVVDYNSSSPNDTTVTAVFDLGVAYNPNPAHGQSKVSLTPTLTWTPGDYVNDVNGHQVYFGTSFADVTEANLIDPRGVYQGVRNVNNFAPAGPLDISTIYYWRIDEVNDANTNSPWKGNVWRFTTTPCPYGGTVFTGNLTDDCIVDLYDVKVMSQEWLTAGIKADIYPDVPDGIVDFRDFAILAKNWLVEEY